MRVHKSFTTRELALLSLDERYDQLAKAGFDTAVEIYFEPRIDGGVYSQILPDPVVEPTPRDPLAMVEELESRIKAYFEQVALIASAEGMAELNYSKTPITTPDGGLYLISILHVSGPKFKLQK